MESRVIFFFKDQIRLPNGYLPTSCPGPFARFWDKMAANLVPFRGGRGYVWILAVEDLDVIVSLN